MASAGRDYRTNTVHCGNSFTPIDLAILKLHQISLSLLRLAVTLICGPSKYYSKCPKPDLPDLHVNNV